MAIRKKEVRRLFIDWVEDERQLGADRGVGNEQVEWEATVRPRAERIGLRWTRGLAAACGMSEPPPHYHPRPGDMVDVVDDDGTWHFGSIYTEPVVVADSDEPLDFVAPVIVITGPS